MSSETNFLLKTLLFLLCLYIKRATAAAAGLSVANYNPPQVNQTILQFDDKLTWEEEHLVTFDCPLEELVRIKPRYSKKAHLPKYEALKNQTINATQIHWTKDDRPIHRISGDPIWGPPGSRYLSIFRISVDDFGVYTCHANYSNAPKDVFSYYDLYAGAKFRLKVAAISVLPDTKPFVSHQPKDLIVRRGLNVTFTCQTEPTHMTQFKYWFKSCDILTQSERPNCTTEFTDLVTKADKQTDSKLTKELLQVFFIEGERGDKFQILNASEKDIATYGCFVYNHKGHDIRMGSLNLVDRFVESEFGTTPTNQVFTTTPLTKILGKSTIENSPKLLDNANNFIEVKTAESRGELTTGSVLTGVSVIIGVFAVIISVAFYCIMRCFVPKKEQKLNQNNIEPLVGDNSGDLRQHLPSVKCPDIYSISRNDGFISGHLHQSNGQLMTQSICGDILEKNPSISSNTNSDEASSWGKSLLSHSDNCKAFYLHTSNTTATTMPMYDHPPSSSMLCSAVVRNACVSNPLYGYLPDSDASKWAFPRRNLERLNKIGEGQFGEVWRYIARQKDGSESFVAVKQLKNRAGLGDRERLELIAEIEIMKSVSNHSNVIKLLNYCADDYEPILLIMEYAENGKLQTYLRDCRSINKYNPFSAMNHNLKITSKELIKFSYHIAKGMEYISSQGIIHRDLASRNILVSKDKVCKVADFGFARRVSDDCAYERTTANPVPVKWMAPEALTENKFTSKSDVFSLGILMWEIVTLGATPYEYLTSTEVYHKVTAGGRLERPVHCKDEFYSIMSSCWRHDPTHRPSFKELASQLEKLLLSETDYIELDQYPEHAYYNILNTAEKEVVQITPPP